MSGIKVILFNFSCIQLLLDSAACWDTATAPVSWCYYTCVYRTLFRRSLHCSSLQSFRTFHLSNCLLCFRDIRRLVVKTKYGQIRRITSANFFIGLNEYQTSFVECPIRLLFVLFAALPLVTQLLIHIFVQFVFWKFTNIFICIYAYMCKSWYVYMCTCMFV